MATITGCAFQGNESLFGGAISVDNGYFGEVYPPVVMISGCTFADNEAEFGGALSNDGRTNVSGCLFHALSVYGSVHRIVA